MSITDWKIAFGAHHTAPLFHIPPEVLIFQWTEEGVIRDISTLLNVSINAQHERTLDRYDIAWALEAAAKALRESAEVRPADCHSWAVERAG